jgi:hypothetical protein
MNKQEQINALQFRIERIEAKLAEQHISNNFRKLNRSEKPNSCEPDYTHLLPEGYEFCTEQDAEKWVKVEINPDIPELEQTKVGYVWHNPIRPSYNRYRPIRPIQYHISVHESVTAEPDPYTIEKHGDGWAIYKGRDLMHHGANLGQIHDEKLAQYIGGLLKGFKDAEPDPYQVDWEKAPDCADCHSYQDDGVGFWHGTELLPMGWRPKWAVSGFKLPTGLDWKQSKTIRPKLK